VIRLFDIASKHVYKTFCINGTFFHADISQKIKATSEGFSVTVGLSTVTPCSSTMLLYHASLPCSSTMLLSYVP
jgi:hypothetical protein